MKYRRVMVLLSFVLLFGFVLLIVIGTIMWNGAEQNNIAGKGVSTQSPEQEQKILPNIVHINFVKGTTTLSVQVDGINQSPAHQLRQVRFGVAPDSVSASTSDDTLTDVVAYVRDGMRMTNATLLVDVVYVYDGDTVIALVDGKNIPVRLLGIDTPEIKSKYRGGECFGVEASDYLKKLLSDTQVHLELDASQSPYDKYHRLLAYVYLPDKTNVNKLLIERGYAREYTFKKPYTFQKDFRDAEVKARHNRVGMWKEGMCGG